MRDVPFPCDCGYPARMLAECEAKRCIVEEYVAFSSRAPGTIGHADERMVEAALLRCVQALALPFADHPDYNPEWRP